MPVLPAGYLSISDAAVILRRSPGDVARLIDDGRIATVELIRADTLDKYLQDAS